MRCACVAREVTLLHGDRLWQMPRYGWLLSWRYFPPSVLESLLPHSLRPRRNAGSFSLHVPVRTLTHECIAHLRSSRRNGGKLMRSRRLVRMRQTLSHSSMLRCNITLPRPPLPKRTTPATSVLYPSTQSSSPLLLSPLLSSPLLSASLHLSTRCGKVAKNGTTLRQGLRCSSLQSSCAKLVVLALRQYLTTTTRSY